MEAEGRNLAVLDPRDRRLIDMRQLLELALGKQGLRASAT
jgi:hypothetical protein